MNRAASHSVSVFTAMETLQSWWVVSFTNRAWATVERRRWSTYF